MDNRLGLALGGTVIVFLLSCTCGPLVGIPTPTTTPTATPRPMSKATSTPMPPIHFTPTAPPNAEARIGETIPEVGLDQKNLSMTLLGWLESGIAVDGPYVEEKFYTFTARSGMKFVILIFEFRNNDVRAQNSPYLDEGEILTDAGFHYSIWSPPAGIHSSGYSPRPSTEGEVTDLVGSSGGFEKLLPGESQRGRIVFEIPKEQRPIEARVREVPVPISFE